jgi:arylsulfatase A-like enzyme
MNDYRAVVGSRSAPGWTRWWTSLSPTRYYRYVVSDQGRRRHFGQKPQDYITRVLGGEAKRLIQKYANARAPFFLQLDERAPHVSLTDDPYGNCDGEAIPDPRDEGAFADRSLPEPPSFNEADMSDKPAFIRNAPGIGKRGEARLTAKWRCALESLVGVDRNVGQVFDAVKEAGELNNTIFIYISDNGLFYGEHRLPEGKVFPYEEAIHMPMVMRVPARYRDGVRRADSLNQLVANIDIAPTLLQLAHATPCLPDRCRTMDGRSLMPLIDGRGHWPSGRALLNEYRVSDRPRYSTCDFAAIRTRTQIYVEHYRVVNPATHECVRTLQKERYDLAKDPFELNNLCYGGAPTSCPQDASQAQLEARLHRLRLCAGIRGRDPQVAGRPYCE